MKTKERSPSELAGCHGGLYFDGSGYFVGLTNYPLRESPMSAFHARYSLNATAYRDSTIEMKQFQGTEKIVYGENRRPNFNYCNHFKQEAVMHPFTIAHCVPPRINGMWTMPYRRVSAPSNLGSYVKFRFGDDFCNSNVGFSSRAWWTMQPRFEGKISVLNAVFELKDFKHAAKAMSGLVKHGSFSSVIKSFNKNMMEASHPARRGRGSAATPRNPMAKYDPSAISANLLLINNMAIRPLISDFTAILQSLATTVAKAQNEFTDLGAKVQTSHYTEVLEKFDESSPVTFNNDPYYRKGIAGRAQRTATLTYTYKYRRRNSHEAFLKYWGLQATPEAIWNMIPGSFLIDYMVGIANSLHAMNVDKNVDLHKHQYCESVSKKQVQGYWFSGSDSVQIGGIVAGHYVTEHSDMAILTGYSTEDYLRTPCAPRAGLYLPKPVTKVSGMHKLNMAALARVFF